MSSDTTFFDVRAVWRRLLLLVPIAAVFVLGWYVARWHIGSTFAEYPADLETARAAERLAPNDPQAAFTRARLEERELSPDALIEAERSYARAASLAPNDYRLWMELGRVRGMTGDAAGSEQALRRAVELAPAYSAPRWRLGNLLFRRGRLEEGLAELQRAGDADPELRPQIFNLLWRAFEGDTERVIAAAGRSAEARAQLVDHLIARRQLDYARRVWASFNHEERSEAKIRAAGDNLARALFEARQFQSALDVRRSIAINEQLPQPGQILNADFESDIPTTATQLFGWRIASVPQAQIHLDPRNGFGGRGRSLRIAFNAPSPFDFDQSISQLVVVSPRARYRLTYRARTENLQTVSTIVCLVVDPAASATAPALAVSAPVPSQTTDWQTIQIEFTTGANTEGVIIRFARAACPEATCPIFGRVWFDDFNLEQIGGESRSGAAQRSQG
jgi:Tfp pilus assembly protein PilF